MYKQRLGSTQQNVAMEPADDDITENPTAQQVLETSKKVCVLCVLCVLAWANFVKYYADKLKDRPDNIFQRCYAMLIEAGRATKWETFANSYLRC